MTPEDRKLIARDIADAVRLRRCLKEAIPELEIAIGLRDWSGVARALDAIREAMQE